MLSDRGQCGQIKDKVIICYKEKLSKFVNFNTFFSNIFALD